MFRCHDRTFAFSHEEGKQGKPLEKSTWHRHRQIHKAVGVILQQYVIDLHAVEVFGNVASILAKNQTFLKLVLSIISYTFLLIILALSPLIPPFLVFPISDSKFSSAFQVCSFLSTTHQFPIHRLSLQKNVFRDNLPTIFSCQVISSKLATVYFTIHFFAFPQWLCINVFF